MKQEILNKLKTVKLFLFDLEGVLLYNRISFEEKFFKKFISDLTRASDEFQKYNVRYGIATARQKDELIDKLEKIENWIILLTSIEKVSAVEEFVNGLNLSFEEIFYMGDDVLDIPLLTKCGLSAAPKSANREVKRVVDFTINSKSAEEVFQEIFSLLQKTGLKK